MKKLRRKDIPQNAVNVSTDDIEKYFAETTINKRKCRAYFTVVHPKYSTGIEYVRKNIVQYL